MTLNVEKIVQDFTLTHEQGMHLRPAMLLAHTALRFNADVEIRNRQGTSNAKSALGILSLGVEQGGHFAIVAGGVDARDAVQAITALLVSSIAYCRLAPGPSVAISGCLKKVSDQPAR